VRQRVSFTIDDQDYDLAFDWLLCPVCRGRGSHVNPAIDGQGLTAEDFADDPDFAEDYHAGFYDQPCVECHGLRVVPQLRDPCPALDDYRRTIRELRREEAMERGYETG
jgi:hypothetical protein